MKTIRNNRVAPAVVQYAFPFALGETGSGPLHAGRVRCILVEDADSFLKMSALRLERVQKPTMTGRRRKPESRRMWCHEAPSDEGKRKKD